VSKPLTGYVRQRYVLTFNTSPVVQSPVRPALQHPRTVGLRCARASPRSARAPPVFPVVACRLVPPAPSRDRSRRASRCGPSARAWSGTRPCRRGCHHPRRRRRWDHHVHRERRRCRIQAARCRRPHRWGPGRRRDLAQVERVRTRSPGTVDRSRADQSGDGPDGGAPVATTASRLGVPWGTGALPSRWPRRWPSRHDRVGTPPGRCRRGASRRDSMVAPTFDREWMIRLMCRYRSMRAGVRA